MRGAAARRVVALVALLAAAPSPGADRSAPAAGAGIARDASAASRGAAGREVLADTDLPPKTSNRITDRLSYGGDVEIEIAVERGLDLDPGADEDLTLAHPQLELAFTYRLTGRATAFLDVAVERDIAVREPPDARRRETELNVKQLHLTLAEVAPGLSVRVGRQDMEDPREWFFDRELDGLNLVYEGDDLGFEASVNRRNLVDRDLLNWDRNRRINNWFLTGWLEVAHDVELFGYLLALDDRDERRGTPVFLGAQLIGETDDDATFWADAALVRGRGDFDRRRRRQDVLRGHAFDVGATVPFDVLLEPSVTLAYAQGSGESNVADRVDRTFRQTGLQDNNDRFNGAVSLKYYGELFDPELSNLSVLTLGIGVRPSRRSSVDLVFHRYWQRRRSDDQRSIGVDLDPDGVSRHLGNEIDLVIGFREIEDFTAELVLAYFMPGNAFPRGADNAALAELLLRRRF